MRVFRCKLAGNGAALKIGILKRTRRVVEIRSRALSFSSSLFRSFFFCYSAANKRANEEALTSVEGANAAIQSVRDYDAENEKQPACAVQRRAAPRRWVDIMPSGFASVLMTGRIIREKLH